MSQNSESNPTESNPPHGSSRAKKSNSEQMHSRNEDREISKASEDDATVAGSATPPVDFRARLRTKNLRRRKSRSKDGDDSASSDANAGKESARRQRVEKPPSQPEDQERPFDEDAPAVAGKVSSGPAVEEDSDVNLVACGNCGRRFKEDRVEKHEKACLNQKARKQYDTKRHRVMGQDHANYALNEKLQKEAPKKDTNWRAKREEFIRNVRYARQATRGGDVGPPPPSVNPDYVPCPHCGRRFNENAAERHIPRCQDLKTKAVGQRAGASSNSAKTIAPPSKTRRR